MINNFCIMLLYIMENILFIKFVFNFQLLFGKETKWLRDKETCVERITDLAQIFGGNKSLDGIERNQNLHAWFLEISKHIDSLQQEDARKIVQLVQALEEVQGII